MLKEISILLVAVTFASPKPSGKDDSMIARVLEQGVDHVLWKRARGNNFPRPWRQQAKSLEEGIDHVLWKRRRGNQFPRPWRQQAKSLEEGIDHVLWKRRRGNQFPRPWRQQAKKLQLDRELGEITKDDACVRVASAMGIVLENIDVVLSMAATEVDMGVDLRSALEKFVGVNIFDEAERERMVCAFSGVQTYSEYLSVLDELNISYAMVRTMYDILAVTTAQLRFNTETTMIVYADYLPYDVKEQLDLQYRLLAAIEESGFVNLDPTGVQALYDFEPGYWDIAVLPVSIAPTDVKCNEIANAARKYWQLHMETAAQNEPDIEEDVKALIAHWTGLDVGNFGQVKGDICDLLEAGLEQGVMGVYAWVQQKGIIQHLMKAGYPLMVEQTQQVKLVMELYTNPHYAEAGGGVPDELVSAMEGVLGYIEGLEEMGMLSLRDDL